MKHAAGAQYAPEFAELQCRYEITMSLHYNARAGHGPDRERIASRPEHQCALAPTKPKLEMNMRVHCRRYLIDMNFIERIVGKRQW